MTKIVSYIALSMHHMPVMLVNYITFWTIDNQMSSFFDYKNSYRHVIFDVKNVVTLSRTWVLANSHHWWHWAANCVELMREFLLSLQMLKRCPYPANSFGLAQEVGQSAYALAGCPQLSHLSEFDLVSLWELIASYCHLAGSCTGNGSLFGGSFSKTRLAISL